MSDDDPDIEDLLSPDWEKEEFLSPMQIAQEASSMDQPQGLVLNKIYSFEELSLPDLADEIGLDRDSTEQAVNKLILQGYVGTRLRDGTEVYYIRESWGTQEFPSGPVIPLVYQYNLLCDSKRLSALKSAVETVVEEGDVVADLGAGVGALSHFAAGEAEQVYAVELDREVYEQGKATAAASEHDNIQYRCEDARSVEFNEPIDVIFCEMIDTALLAELQVPVMNHAVETIIDDDTDVIPLAAKTTVQLVRSDYEFEGVTFRLPHFEEYGSRESESMSDEAAYHEVRFDEHTPRVVREHVELTADTAGTVNGIQLNTYIRFAEGMEWTAPSKWFNAPLTLPTDQDIDVDPGDTIGIDLLYKLGSGLNNIEYTVALE